MSALLEDQPSEARLVMAQLGTGPATLEAVRHLEAFEVHAVDYLLKPLADEQFEASLELVDMDAELPGLVS